MEFITTQTGVNMYMSGPLAEFYSQGLNQLYAKETGEVPAMESQALDMGVARRNYLIRKKPILDADDRANMSMFYGVQKGQVRTEHVIDIVDALASMSGERRRRCAVVVDAMIRITPGQPPREMTHVTIEPAELALEQYCAQQGVPVYTSFDAFAQVHG